MSVEENKAIVRRWHEEVFSKKDIKAIDELAHPDYVHHTSNMRFEDAKEQFIQWVSGLPEAQYLTEDTIAEGDKVVTRWTRYEEGRATHTGISIHRIADGKIIEDWACSRPLPEA